MKKAYFIGIGGIGMSAIARYYNFKGYEVSGYDRTPSDLTAELEAEGISIHYEDRPDLVPEDIDNTIVVYTPAIPRDMAELVHVQEKGYRVVKRSRMLGEISRGQCCLAVAGTHGKTTTSSMIAHIWTDSGAGCSAFLGGISKDYGTNLLTSLNPVIVAEADEFDRSFLQLFPEVAVITSMDADHLDIYSDHEHVKEAFRAFAGQTSGILVLKKGLPIDGKDTPAKIFTYAYDDPSADFHAENIAPDGCGRFTFDLVHPGGRIAGCSCGVPGWVNVENSVAAAAVAILKGIPSEAVRKALASFQGAKRRFDLHFSSPRISYIDDYAHHPAEIRASISSMRDIFPGRHVTVVFQPHLYTRTRDFAEGFAEALSLADRVVLLDIYPAREEPIPGVTSEIIFERITCPEKILITKEELMDTLESLDLDVIATVGAGNIDRFIEPIGKLAERKAAAL